MDDFVGRAVASCRIKAMVRRRHWLHDHRDDEKFIAKEMQLHPADAFEGREYYNQNRLWSVDGEPNIEERKHILRV